MIFKETDIKFREIFLKSPIGILFYDKEGKLIAANQSAKDIAGIPESEDVSVNLFNNPDVVSRKEKLIGEGVIKFQSQMNFEDIREAGYYEPTRSGTAYLDFTISVVDSGYLVQIQDITKRKKIEERLTENEKKYRELVENANSIILKMDKKGQITFFNEFAEKFFGFNKEKIMGKNVIGTIVPETESSGRNLRELINRIVSDPESHINTENENITHDKRRVWVAWTNKGIYNDDGEVTGVLSIGTDITKRKDSENAFKHLMLETSKSKNLILKELREAHNNLELKVQKRTRELNESNYALRKEIQERKHVEYKLKEQLNFLQHLIDVIPVPIFYKDINYVYVGCNHAFEELMGIYRENIIGKTQYDIAPKELADKHYEMDQKLFENPGTQVYEALVRYADNTMHSVVFNKATYTDIEGNIIGLIGVIIDITGVKKAEEKIRRLADIVESSDDAIISHTFDGIITSWNKGAEKVYGYSAREMLGKHAYAALSPSQYGEVKRNMEKVKNGRKLAHYEAKRIRKDGKEIYVSVNLSPIINPEGKLTGVSVIARDITESKKIEEDLIKSRNYLDKIINSIADPVFVKDDQHRWILLNDAYCKLIGYSREEILGKSDYDFFPSREADIFWEKDEEVFKTGLENVNEEEFTDSEGNVHILVTKKTLYTDISGEQYIVASIRDITERKKTENSLRQSERKLTLAMDMAKLAYWEYDVSLDLFTFDDRFYKLYGTTADHEGGSKMSSEEYAQKFLPPEESHLVNEEMAKALQTDDPDFFGQVE
ncbi:MAG: PAS domain S-box protein, partial [Methanobacterium sp.]